MGVGVSVACTDDVGVGEDGADVGVSWGMDGGAQAANTNKISRTGNVRMSCFAIIVYFSGCSTEGWGDFCRENLSNGHQIVLDGDRTR